MDGASQETKNETILYCLKCNISYSAIVKHFTIFLFKTNFLFKKWRETEGEIWLLRLCILGTFGYCRFCHFRGSRFVSGSTTTLILSYLECSIFSQFLSPTNSDIFNEISGPKRKWPSSIASFVLLLSLKKLKLDDDKPVPTPMPFIYLFCWTVKDDFSDNHTDLSTDFINRHLRKTLLRLPMQNKL